MKQGDATWTTSKVILGWLIDTTAKTIALPPHCIERLREILGSIALGQRTIAMKDWHKVVCELCSMSIALPSSVALFSLLQGFNVTTFKSLKVAAWFPQGFLLAGHRCGGATDKDRLVGY